MSDGNLANHWPATGVDERISGARLVTMADLTDIVRRLKAGNGSIGDRMTLIDLASEIDVEAAGTELAELAISLRRVALRVGVPTE